MTAETIRVLAQCHFVRTFCHGRDSKGIMIRDSKVSQDVWRMMMGEGGVML